MKEGKGDRRRRYPQRLEEEELKTTSIGATTNRQQFYNDSTAVAAAAANLQQQQLDNESTAARQFNSKSTKTLQRLDNSTATSTTASFELDLPVGTRRRWEKATGVVS